MTKDFLPRTTMVSMIPLRDRINDILENNVPGPKVIKMPGKLNVCVRKIFPILGIFSLFFGSAFLGFSFVNVHEGQVGYYAKKDCFLNHSSNASCTIRSFPPGLYFEMPWKKEYLQIVNVSPSTITYGTYDKIFEVDYEITDVKKYLNALVSFKTEQDLDVAVKEEIKKYVRQRNKKPPFKPPYNMSLEIYGMSFKKIIVVV